MTSSHSSSQSFTIIGAGLLGRLLAWQLLMGGHRVTLFEKSAFTQPRAAGYTAAAMISPMSEVVVSDRKIYDLGIESLGLWPEIIDALNKKADSTHNIRYVATGSIVVAHPQDHAELQQFKQDLQAHLKADDNSSWLSNKQLAEMEPAIGHFTNGLYLPGEAYLDNHALLDELLRQIRQLGGRCIDNTSTSVAQCKKNDDSDWIIDCRGIGASESFPTIRGVRGEVLWVETKEVVLRHAIRLCHPRYKLYVVPKPGNQFIIGATEIESEDLSPISLQSNLELASALYTINPAFAEARIITSDVNLRPSLPDNLPAIVYDGNCIAVNGLYRHGYLLAPAMTRSLLNHVFTQKPSAQLSTSII